MIAHRYILKQMLKPLVAVFLGLNGLLLVVQLLKVGEVTFAAGLTFGDLWRTMVYFLPSFVVITGPVTVLVGVLMGFAKMSEDGELVALAACGFGPWRLAVIPVLVGLVFWGLSFFFATVLAPSCTGRLEKNFASLAKRQVVASLKAGEFFEDIPRLVLYPSHSTKAAGVFKGFLLYDHRPGHVRHMLLASKAKMLAKDAGNGLDLNLSDGQVHARDKAHGLYSVVDFVNAEVGIDIEKVIRDRTRFLQRYEAMSMEQLSSMASGKGHESKADRLRAASALHRRFSFPAACLLFALLALGVGQSGKLSSRRSTLVAAGAMVTGYYLLVRLLDVLVLSGTMNPAVASWTPNLAVLVLVGWMMLRKERGA